MTEERIKQIAMKCYWKTDVMGSISTTCLRHVTKEIIEDAIRQALLEYKREKQ